MARISEEFGVPLAPGTALDQPVRLALEIIDLRAYAKAYALVEAADEDHEPPDWASDLVLPVAEDVKKLLVERERERASHPPA